MFSQITKVKVTCLFEPEIRGVTGFGETIGTLGCDMHGFQAIAKCQEL